MITAANPFLRFSKYSFFGRFGGTIKIQPASWDFSSMSKYSPTKKSKRMITQKRMIPILAVILNLTCFQTIGSSQNHEWLVIFSWNKSPTNKPTESQDTFASSSSCFGPYRVEPKVAQKQDVSAKSCLGYPVWKLGSMVTLPKTNIFAPKNAGFQ